MSDFEVGNLNAIGQTFSESLGAGQSDVYDFLGTAATDFAPIPESGYIIVQSNASLALIDFDSDSSEPGGTDLTGATEDNSSLFLSVAQYGSAINSDGAFIQVSDYWGDPTSYSVTFTAAPSFSVSNAVVQTSSKSATVEQFTISLSAPALYLTTFTYSTSNGSAVAGTNYTGISKGTVTIAPGQSSAVVDVTVAAASGTQSSEFFLNVNGDPNNTSNDDGSPVQAGGFINEPVIESSSPTATVGPNAKENFVITFAGPAPSSNVTLDYTTITGGIFGSAVQNTDYTFESGSITISKGSTSGTISIPLINTASPGPTKTFGLFLDNATGGAILDPTTDDVYTATILNTSIALDTAVTDTLHSVGESDYFPVSLTAGTTYTARVLPGSTSPATSPVVSVFNPGGNLQGSTGSTVTFTALTTGTYEFDVTAGMIGSYQFQVDNDTMSVAPVTVVAPTSGTALAEVTVQFAHAVTGPYSFVVSTANGAATAGVNYTAVNETITGTSGSSVTFGIPIIGSALPNIARTFTVNLSNITGIAGTTSAGTTGSASALSTTVTIDDDVAAPTLTASPVSGDVAAAGQQNWYVAKLFAGITYEVSVVPKSGSTGLTNGQVLVVDPNGATVDTSSSATSFVTADATGTFSIGVSAGSNGTGNYTASIQQVPLISIGNVSVNQTNAPTTATLTVSLVSSVDQTVTLSYATSNGTSAGDAQAGTDYLATEGTLTFAPGQDQQTITVPIEAATSAGPPESFTVSLSNPSLGEFANAQATVAIDDTLAATTGGGASVDAATGSHSTSDSVASVSENGQYVVYANGGTVYLVNRASPQTTTTLAVSGGTVTAPAISGNGQYVVYGVGDDVYLWNTVANTVTLEATTPAAVFDVAISSDGTVIGYDYAGGLGPPPTHLAFPGEVVAKNLVTGATEFTIPSTVPVPAGFSFSANDTQLYYNLPANESGVTAGAYDFNLGTDSVTDVFASDPAVTAALFAANGSYVLEAPDSSSVPVGTSQLYFGTASTPLTSVVEFSSGAPGDSDNGESFSPSISADGQYVAFITLQSTVDTGIANNHLNDGLGAYVYDTVTGLLYPVVDPDASGVPAAITISANGQTVTELSETGSITTVANPFTIDPYGTPAEAQLLPVDEGNVVSLQNQVVQPYSEETNWYKLVANTSGPYYYNVSVTETSGTVTLRMFEEDTDGDLHEVDVTDGLGDYNNSPFPGDDPTPLNLYFTGDPIFANSDLDLNGTYFFEVEETGGPAAYTIAASDITWTGVPDPGDLSDIANTVIAAADAVFAGNNGNFFTDGGTATTWVSSGGQVYDIQSSASFVVAGPDSGDTIYSSVNGYQLPYNVDDLVLNGGATYGIGNGQNDILIGGPNNDVFNPEGGDAVIDGAAGANTVVMPNDPVADFNIASNGSSVTGPGLDYTLYNIQYLQFENNDTVRLPMAVSATAGAVPMNILPPSGPSSFTVTALPSSGTVLMSNGTSVVTLGESLGTSALEALLYLPSTTASGTVGAFGFNSGSNGQSVPIDVVPVTGITVAGGPGNNTYSGVGSNSVLDYHSEPGAVSINMGTGTVQNAYGGSDTISDFATVNGSDDGGSYLGGSTNTTYGVSGGTNLVTAGSGGSTAAFSGLRGNFIVTDPNGSQIVVTAPTGGTETATLSGVADLDFANLSLFATYEPTGAASGKLSSDLWMTRLGELTGASQGPALQLPAGISGPMFAAGGEGGAGASGDMPATGDAGDVTLFAQMSQSSIPATAAPAEAAPATAAPAEPAALLLARTGS
jgi:hypothetical protein